MEKSIIIRTNASSESIWTFALMAHIMNDLLIRDRAEDTLIFCPNEYCATIVIDGLLGQGWVVTKL